MTEELTSEELKAFLSDKKNAMQTLKKIMGEDQFKKATIETFKHYFKNEIEDLIKESEDGETYTEEEINELIYEAFTNGITEEEQTIKPVVINAPNNIILLNDKLSKGLANMENRTLYPVLEAFNGQDIEAIINNDNVKTSKPLERFDIHILESVISLYNNDNNHIEEMAIKRLITQNKDRKRTQLNKDIVKSLDKLQETFITIKCFNPKTKEETQIKAPILPMISVKQTINGSKKDDDKKDIYIINSTPPILEFINLMNKPQLITADNKLLEAPIKKDKYNINILFYIVARVKDMQKQTRERQKPIKVIRYDTLFKECEILQDLTDPTKYKKDKAKYRKIIKDILEYHKTIKFIKDYAEIKEGKEFTKIEIEL